jgi:hypothetical protein
LNKSLLIGTRRREYQVAGVKIPMLQSGWFYKIRLEIPYSLLLAA